MFMKQKAKRAAALIAGRLQMSGLALATVLAIGVATSGVATAQ